MNESTGFATKRSSRRRRLARMWLVLAGFLVALVIGEFALRLSGFNYFNPYLADAELGFVLRPNASGWWLKEGRTYIQLNSNGFRDREHTIAKPPGTFRIAVLGDSYAEALQVPMESTFWTVMEHKLSQCSSLPTSKVEVLNFGISGFSTGRELILLRKRVWQYAPDAIVLLVTPSNDISDNSLSLNQYSNQPLPYFVLQDGKLILDDSRVVARNNSLHFRLQNSFAGTAFNWIRDHVRLLGLVYQVRESYLSRGRPPRPKAEGTTNPAVFEQGLDSEVYKEPLAQEWKDAWAVTEKLIVQMRDEVQTKGARYLVVVGSAAIQDNPDAEARKKFMALLGVENLYYPNERIMALANREKFEALDLAPPLADYASRSQVVLHGTGPTLGTGHWNTTGHFLAGELIAQQLCQPSR